MRRYLIALVALVALVGAPASADPPAPKSKAIDAKAVAEKLEVFRDDLGSFYVVPAPGRWDDLGEAGAWVFFGDGKSMWQQRIVGSSSSSSAAGPELEWDVWSPRVKDMQTAAMVSIADGLTLQCSQRRPEDRKLTPLRADEAKVFFARATFLPPLWQRQSRLLARDDDGTYYFVDMIREDLGGKGYRVFVGPKGTLKELQMTNVVEDSGGQIFATKGGQLKIIASANNEVFWIKGGKKTELTMLEPIDNRYLIYRELGIYGRLGAVCDDL